MSGPWPAEVAHLPICPRRALPIPYIAEITPDGAANFTILDEERAAECIAGRLCAMCGQRMRGQVAFIGDEVSLKPGGWWIEPPVHERCAELALGGLCPYLSGQRVPRRSHEGDPSVSVVGSSAARLAEVGRTVPKRPVVIAISATYAPHAVPSNTGAPVRAYQAGRVERVRRYAYDASGRLAESWPRPADPPMVRVQRRRRTRAQRRQP